MLNNQVHNEYDKDNNDHQSRDDDNGTIPIMIV